MSSGNLLCKKTRKLTSSYVCARTVLLKNSACPIYSFKLNYEECVSDKKNRWRRRRLADAWRLNPGLRTLESPRYVFTRVPHLCTSSILWMPDQIWQASSQVQTILICLASGTPHSLYYYFYYLRTFQGPRKCERCCRRGKILACQGPPARHTSVASWPKTRPYNAEGAEKMWGRDKTPAENYADFSGKAHKQAEFFPGFKYFTPIKSF
jgi:hypothetical protein